MTPGHFMVVQTLVINLVSVAGKVESSRESGGSDAIATSTSQSHITILPVS